MSKEGAEETQTSKQGDTQIVAPGSGPAGEPPVDGFGLPVKPRSRTPTHRAKEGNGDEDGDTFQDAEDIETPVINGAGFETGGTPMVAAQDDKAQSSTHDTSAAKTQSKSPSNPPSPAPEAGATVGDGGSPGLPVPVVESETRTSESKPTAERSSIVTPSSPSNSVSETKLDGPPLARTKNKREKNRSSAGPAVSEWSHQSLAPAHTAESESEEEEEWKAMPAIDEFDVFDDDGNLVARGMKVDDEEAVYGGLGGAGKGYTRLQLEEDAKSATSLDEDTSYLFKEGQSHSVYDDEDQRDAMSQLEATKDLLTEGQRIAYVGVTRLTIYKMVKELQDIDASKGIKKDLTKAVESMEKWGQQMMVRLYKHMDIDPAEQIMIEQLAEHGVQPTDLVPPLMQSSRVKNPMAEGGFTKPPPKSDSAMDSAEAPEGFVAASSDARSKSTSLHRIGTNDDEVPSVQTPSQMTKSDKIDLDLRWTVLCDLFLLLISESLYDSRSRLLLERVASAMDISWVQICRFEKRIIDALEMQEEAAKENWNETNHIETRRKMGLKRKYIYMGLATVGGGLVIGLSAGLLAPVIGAGLAAGFTTIGVTGTAGFLGGVGGITLITSAATAAGGTIAVRASHRRTGHVSTFEYRPLHNNKRVNLILTVSGWMNGKVDDVRLPYSTVDPIMGDIYSLLWEPEMLQSMGDTIKILATEALTTTLQQVLGATILTSLMAAISLPVVLTKLSYFIDNPWTVSLDRANAGGLILADSLIDRHLGNRPITLIGFSLGSRLIFSCLKELAARGAYGLIQNVYLFGAPIVANKDEFLRARSVVAGRFVNGYASNDWILGYLFRATSGGIMRVAGLAPVKDIPGLENLDVTPLVNGHMAYRAAMPRLLREVGWEVESDEFTEIEDPDPENHEMRQRELIREIDEARKEAQTKPEKRRFGFFKKGKLAEQKGWEMYNASGNGYSRNGSMKGIGSPDLDGTDRNAGVLFDIEAIKRELASEMIEVRELEGTMPVMQVHTRQGQATNAGLGLQQTGDSEAGAMMEGLKADELARMNLPPRPDEIDSADHSTTILTINGKPPSHRPIPTSTTPPRSPPRPYPYDEFEAAPRELKTTLPPLHLPSFHPLESSRSHTPPASSSLSRPELKSRSTTPAFSTMSDSQNRSVGEPPAPAPAPPTAAGGVGGVGGAQTLPLTTLNIEHNAWADDENFGHEEGEIRMTFA